LEAAIDPKAAWSFRKIEQGRAARLRAGWFSARRREPEIAGNPFQNPGIIAGLGR
jgi:hypothetical protein